MNRTRRPTIAMFLSVLLILAAGIPARAQPPGLPSSFYGEVAIDGYDPSADALVHVYLDADGDGLADSLETRVASTSVRQIADPLRWVYAVDVPHAPATDGAALVFELSQPPTTADGTLTVVEDSGATSFAVAAAEGLGSAGTAMWHTGTNARLDLTTISPYGLTLAVTTGPVHGLAAVDALSLSYTPDANYCGSDALGFSVVDRAGQSDSAKLTISVTCANDAPTALALSRTDVDEGLPAGSAVGTFSVTDVDADDTHTYSLVPDPDDGDNAAFQIVGNALQTRVVLDHAARSSYTIGVRATDGGRLYTEAQFTITVNDVNSAPTDISLTAPAVQENAAIGTTVGTLSAVDADSGDAHTFTLVAGAGDSDNASFAIQDSALVTAAVFDYEARSAYSVRVQASDGHGGTYAKAFAIDVSNVNEAPVVSAVPGQTITQVGAFATVDLASHVSDPDAGDTVTWSCTGSTALTVVIVGGQATISRAIPEWDGAETITFTARDSGGLQGSVSAEFRVLARQSIPLTEGWNLIGMGLVPQVSNTSSVLASIAGQYDLVYAWDASQEEWRLHSSEAGYPNLDLTSLDRSMGLWVHATTEDAILVIDGIAEGTTTVPIEPEAWHLATWPSGVSGTLPGALDENGLANNYVLVYAYHADEAEDPWQLYDPAGASWANDLTRLEPGHGYWILAGSDTDGSWSVTYEKAPLS